MKKEQGFSTLLITVVISLIMALYVFSLLSVEFFNSKKTQNVILAQEVKAKANSGLQCAVDIIIRTGKKPDSSSIDYSPCNDAVIRVERIETSNKYKVIAKSVIDEAEAVSSRIISSSSLNGPQAAISSSGSISFDGHNIIDPFEGEKVGGGYNCIAIRSGGKVSVTGTELVIRHPLNQLGHPKIGLDGKEITCNESHFSGKITPSSTKYMSDIIQNIEGMDLFKENFGVERVNWQEVKDKFDVFIPGTTISVDIPDPKGGTKTVSTVIVNDCSSEINKVIAYNRSELKKSEQNNGYKPTYKKYIWVNGSCDMTNVSFTQTEKSDLSVTLVIKDGLVTTDGPKYFHGNVYLFDFAMTDEQLLAAWETKKDRLKPEAVGHNYDLKNTPFFFNGAFITRGAFNLDSPNRVCRFRGAFKPGYSKGKVDYEDSRFGKTVVLEGSWHDF